MNYRETKNFAVSDFIDSDNSDASIRFCLESDLVPKPDMIFKPRRFNNTALKTYSKTYGNQCLTSSPRLYSGNSSEV